MNKISINIILFSFLLLVNICSAFAERIKDLADIDGVRNNQLVGYGLVVGLNKTGDKTRFTGQSVQAMLNRLGMCMK
jgi:flagellar P-ring protein precursor FlgI